MPVVAQHAPGTFCWPELNTSDTAGAKAFYTALFGWEFDDLPLGGDSVYTMWRKGAHQVGALSALDPRVHPPGTPPHWFSYVATADADAAAAKTEALGGKVLMPPFDVMDSGRMAVLMDPAGAAFGLWQAKQHTGSALLGEPGSLAWTQLNAADPAAAAPFYAGLFGWAHRRDPMPWGGFYVTFMAGEERRGGGMPLPPGVNAPAHWLPYFAVEDVDAAAAKAGTLGGKPHVPPTDIPGTGRFAVLADPQGAAFAIVKFSA